MTSHIEMEHLYKKGGMSNATALPIPQNGGGASEVTKPVHIEFAMGGIKTNLCNTKYEANPMPSFWKLDSAGLSI